MSNNIGVILDPHSFENQEYVTLKAERNGFDSVWVTELYRSSFEQLTFLATISKTIKLGSAVTLAFTRSPLILAISALDIDELSNGRLILGIGSGAINSNRHWHNQPNFDEPTNRIQSLHSVFRGIEKSIRLKEDFVYNDKYYNFAIKSFKRPFDTFRSEIPLYLGGIGPKMTDLSSRLYDGFIGHVVCSPGFLKDYVVPVFKKNNSQSKRTSIVLCSINIDRKKAIDDAKGTIAFYSTVKAYLKPFIDLGYEEEVSRIRKAFFENDYKKMLNLVPDKMVNDFAICGDREEAKEQIKRYKDLLTFPILTVPHYYLDPLTVRAYQDEMLDTFKL